MQQFCGIFGKKGDGWHMILGDNPARHGFVLRDLVLIELSGHGMHLLPSSMHGEEGVRKFNFGGGGVGGGLVILK